MNWRKSSYSTYNGNCVEVADFRKSSHGGADGCVEVGHGDSVVAVRDTQDRDGPVLTFGGEAWKVFVSSLRPCVPS